MIDVWGGPYDGLQFDEKLVTLSRPKKSSPLLPPAELMQLPAEEKWDGSLYQLQWDEGSEILTIDGPLGRTTHDLVFVMKKKRLVVRKVQAPKTP